METEGGHELLMLLNHCSPSQRFPLEQKNVSQQKTIKDLSEQLICCCFIRYVFTEILDILFICVVYELRTHEV